MDYEEIKTEAWNLRPSIQERVISKKLILLVKTFSMPYLPHTDGVLVASLQEGSRIQVSDQAMHDPSRQWCLKWHLFPKKH